MTTMSPDLIAFLKAWYDWATNGAPEHEPFSRRAGLCSQVEGPAYEELKIIRQNQFSDGGWVYPFGEADYSARVSNATQHECPNRLAWVRERLIEAGEFAA